MSETTPIEYLGRRCCSTSDTGRGDLARRFIDVPFLYVSMTFLSLSNHYGAEDGHASPPPVLFLSLEDRSSRAWRSPRKVLLLHETPRHGHGFPLRSVVE